MRKVFMVALTGMTLLVTSCGSYTGNGTLLGTGAGAALGAGIGALIGGGKGAAIGSAVGAGVGAGTGALIGRHMDKKKAELEAQLANAANVETVTDSQGLAAIKVTFNADMTFGFNKTTLSASAQDALKKFAAQMSAADMINTTIQIKGHTDNKGSAAANEKVSLQRAQSVGNVLRSNGIAASRIGEEGCSYNFPVADNSTDAGRAQNRRVEVYVLATDAMIKQAEAGNL